MASRVASVMAFERACFSAADCFGSFIAAMMALNAAVSLSMSFKNASLSDWARSEFAHCASN